MTSKYQTGPPVVALIITKQLQTPLNFVLFYGSTFIYFFVAKYKQHNIMIIITLYNLLLEKL